MKRFSFFLSAILGMSILFGCTKEVEPSYEGKYVDLGLSVKWAQTNLGATKREDFGDYFAWGETTPKKEYSEENYKWYDKDGMLTKYCSDPTKGRVDDKVILDPEDDAATVILGADWRTPTLKECVELLEKCTWTWSSLGGIRGYMVTSNVPGYTDKYIFLPTGGSCVYDDPPVTNYQGAFWTSVNDSDNFRSHAFLTTIITTRTNSQDRWFGFNIRPVYNK